jgi:hypothetical protein
MKATSWRGLMEFFRENKALPAPNTLRLVNVAVRLRKNQGQMRFMVISILVLWFMDSCFMVGLFAIDLERLDNFGRNFRARAPSQRLSHVG